MLNFVKLQLTQDTTKLLELELDWGLGASDGSIVVDVVDRSLSTHSLCMNAGSLPAFLMRYTSYLHCSRSKSRSAVPFALALSSNQDSS